MNDNERQATAMVDVLAQSGEERGETKASFAVLTLGVQFLANIKRVVVSFRCHVVVLLLLFRMSAFGLPFLTDLSLYCLSSVFVTVIFLSCFSCVI